MTAIDHFHQASRDQPLAHRSRLLSRMSVVLGVGLLLLAVALIYRAHVAMDGLIPASVASETKAQSAPQSRPPAPAARPYEEKEDVWRWLEPLPPTF